MGESILKKNSGGTLYSGEFTIINDTTCKWIHVALLAKVKYSINVLYQKCNLTLV